MTGEELAIRNMRNERDRKRYAREKAAGSDWYQTKLAYVRRMKRVRKGGTPGRKEGDRGRCMECDGIGHTIRSCAAAKR